MVEMEGEGRKGIAVKESRKVEDEECTSHSPRPSPTLLLLEYWYS